MQNSKYFSGSKKGKVSRAFRAAHQATSFVQKINSKTSTRGLGTLATTFRSPRDVSRRIYNRSEHFRVSVGRKAGYPCGIREIPMPPEGPRREYKVPPGSVGSQVRKGRKRNDAARIRPRRHPMSDRQAPMVSGPHVSVHTAPTRVCTHGAHSSACIRTQRPTCTM